MLDNDSWSRLLDRLISVTRDGELGWKRKDISSSHSEGSIMKFNILSSFSKQRVLQAATKSAVYELTSDPFGRAPFELAVWEKVNERTKPIDSIKSSASVDVYGNYMLNRKLEQLFKEADSSIENPEEVVDRLLGDFDK